MITDCKDCGYLSCTEEEQTDIHEATGEHKPHYCQKYGKRLFHRCCSVKDPRNPDRIWPCAECIKEAQHE